MIVGNHVRSGNPGGRVTARNGEAYAYNARNELASATYPNAAYAYAYDEIGDQKSAKPKPEARGDRDFKATPQEWSEERYPATQRTSKERKAQAGARGDRDFKATPQEWSEERYSATQRQQSIVMYIEYSWDNCRQPPTERMTDLPKGPDRRKRKVRNG